MPDKVEVRTAADVLADAASGGPLEFDATLDGLREEISTGLGKPDAARWLTISFTGDRKWIA